MSRIKPQSCYASGTKAMEKWALITGASAGIGRELAELFAADHVNLVLVARDQARLNDFATELRSRHHIETLVIVQDLSRPGAAAEVFAVVGARPVWALVNNAGFGAYGPFANSDLKRQSAMMQLNMTALVELTHLFLQPMLQRGEGRILNVASTAAFQPGPRVNVYYATKAFVYSFSYALADELEGTGVHVTTLCPGTTRTEFFERAGISMQRPWPMMEPRAVAEAGYHGLMRGSRVVIPGLANKLASFLAKRAPARLTSAVVKRIHQKRAKNQSPAPPQNPPPR